MSHTLEPFKTYWAYQGSAYQAPLYVFNTEYEAVTHADANGEMNHTRSKEGWCDWVNRNIQQYREDELQEELRIQFIGMEAA